MAYKDIIKSLKCEVRHNALGRQSHATGAWGLCLLACWACGQTSEPAPEPAVAAPKPALAAPSSQPSAAVPAIHGSPAAPVERADQPSNEAVAPELRAAVDAFCQALRDGDSAAFLRWFAQDRPWHIINTHFEGQPAAAVSYERLAEALSKRDDLYVALFGLRPERNLRPFVSGTYAAAWQAVGPYQFVPQGLASGKVWMAWRKQGDRWFVDTIAAPLP